MTVAEAVGSLLRRYPNRYVLEGDLPGYIQDYVDDLSDLPDVLVIQAILTLRKTSTFMPQVGEIRRMIVEAVAPIPTVSEATMAIRRYLQATGEAQTQMWSELHPSVREVVKRVTVWTLRQDPRAIEQFRSDYAEYRKTMTDRMIAGIEPIPALPESIARQMALT
jgi:hypothetical protein